jgi:endonuclease/exonuclease/phosphatase family metal-dependent hydrolase
VRESSGSHQASMEAHGPPAGAADPSLRVGTFNIKHGVRSDGRVDHRALVTSCAGLEADILGLQEVDRFRPRTRCRDQAALVARLGYERFYGAVLHFPPFGAYGNALLVRGAIVAAESVRLPRPSTRQARGAIIARVVCEGHELTVAVTHLQNQPKNADGVPPEAPEQLHWLLERLRRLPQPRVLVGDFNLSPARAVPLLAAADFDTVHTRPTFPADEPRITLDYVAVSGCRIVDAEVRRTAVSDHRAVVATVRVRDSDVA